MTPTQDWLNQAINHIRQTCQAMRPGLLEAQGKAEATLKADSTIVTAKDVQVEHTLKEALASLDASIPFSGEETGADYSAKTHWLVDPIDGTEMFVRGQPFATNMIALIENNAPILGVIYNFMLDEFYAATKGQGAERNGHPIAVSERELPRSILTLAGKMPDKDGCLHNAIGQKIFVSARYNASGYELSSVAKGALEGAVVYKSRSKPWDLAPGALIVQEAGGRVRCLDDGSDGYDCRKSNYIFTNNVICDDLYNIMRTAIAEQA